jgi:ketosteroid isomerase-like protein
MLSVHAIRPAKEKPMSELKALAHRWHDMVATGAFAAWSDLVDVEFVLRMPYAPPGVPEELRGLDARDALAKSRQGQERFEWKEVVVTATEDPELLITTARSEVLLKSGGTYANRYVMLTRFRDGKVLDHTEYFNPLPVIELFKA